MRGITSCVSPKELSREFSVRSVPAVAIIKRALLPVLAVAGVTVLSPVQAAKPAGAVTQDRVLQSREDVGNWLLHGRTFEDQRYTPAKQIDQSTVSRLGLAWFTDIPSPDGLISAPIVVDGVMYISAPMSKVYALDAKSGKVKWSYDPEIKLDINFMVSFGARQNRGVAVWDGKVIVGTADCRLVALDAQTGSVIWQAEACDSKNWYYKNAAPRVGGGMVFSGTSGSEVGVRGFVDAYDAATGKRL